jgi:drug/metabolite transporter (DMT)-like permease
VLELYSIWFQSRRASEAVGTIFAAPAFIVLPPVLEAFAKLVHIPGISSSSADGKTVGILLAVGAVSGFIGFAHFVWYGHLRHGAAVKVEVISQPVAVIVEPAPPPAPASWGAGC